jgi:16S rRNA (cytidine1402-2'-O)-methyltransferase
MSQKSYNGKNSVYIIPTPIGNMEDITIRAINVLKMIDIIFCEDTRVTGQLLKYYDIKKKLISSHNYNEKQNTDKLLKYLNEGLNIGIVSDRGTPIISDPGYALVKCAIDNNYNVISLPGATALIPSLTSSGIAPMPFLFYGFLDSKKTHRIKQLENLKYIKSTLIFYEAPHRIVSTIKDLGNILGNNRKCSISREISKKYEEIYRDTLENIISQIENIKGEIVIVVEGNQNKEDYSEIDLIDHVKLYIDQGMKTMDAIKQVAKERNMKKSDVYSEYQKRGI